MTQVLSYSVPLVCPDCGTELSPALLVCPRCRRLVHGERLNRLAAEASQASAAGDITAALVAWREALELLPPDTKQHAVITARVSELSREMDRLGLKPQARRAGPTATSPGSAGPHSDGRTAAKAAGAAGALGLLLWKFKFLIGFVLTKGKLLLLGLGKGGTFVSMMLSLGTYWVAFGWQFALGMVLSIYVHEMGHVAMLRRYGIKATAPMFIPGLGALIRLKQYPADPREDARTGLAGPIWGLGATAVAYGAFWATGLPVLAAIAEWSARINLFNLTPVWQLDGSHAYRVMTRRDKWAVVGATAAMLLVTHEPVLWFVLLLAGIRTLAEKEEGPGDRWTRWWFLILVVALSALAMASRLVHRT